MKRNKNAFDLIMNKKCRQNAPENAVVVVDGEDDPALESNEERFLPYTGSAKPEWVGFYRGEHANAQRRHMAKCRYCGEVLWGRIELLAKHKKDCSVMPDSIREQLTSAPCSGDPACPKKNNTIPEMFLANMDNQEECDFLFGMYIMTNDISFR